ncbi:UvrD-helicase domain-containing protein [Pseudomonas aeruginosa]|nr:UvrD-helicase domain-containing protein [Pseudomonas aeruginosa]
MDTSGNTLLESDWDADQLRVIEEDADSRLIVEAGPGTGKTAVACARLAYMINEEGNPPIFSTHQK